MTTVASALERIALNLEALASQILAGETIDPDDLILAARRLNAQAEMIRRGIVE